SAESITLLSHPDETNAQPLPVQAAKPAPPRDWAEAVRQLLAAIEPHQRPAVEMLLRDWHGGGRGLREWARSLLRRGKAVPKKLPRELVQVYLDDPDAEPLHDCARCGVAVPVHPEPR